MKNGGSTRHAVRHVEVVHDELFVLSLERGGLDFVSGDRVALHTVDGESRPYSIASLSCASSKIWILTKSVRI